jgi:molybdopterin-guanine dinucleotide biosynthesis protein A
VIEREHVVGVVLAGGHSTRFGSNKLLETVGEEPMVSKVFHTVAPIVAETFLSVAGHPPSDLHFAPCIVDLRPGIGPIGGIHTALETFSYEYFLVVAGDMPSLTSQDLLRLLNAAMPDDDVVLAVDPAGRRHPLVGIYRQSVRPLVLRCIEEGHYAMSHLISLIRSVRLVTFPLDVLTNVNSPGDMPGNQQR